MTLQETSAPWMCISIGCANGFPKRHIPLESEPSGGWDTVWRWVHEETGVSDPDCRYGNALADALNRYFDWHLFPDGVAVSHHWPRSSPFPGSGDQCTAWFIVVRHDTRWFLLLDQCKSKGSSKANGAI